MIIQKIDPFAKDGRRMVFALFTCLVSLIAATIILDYLLTRYRNSAFYFSESLLFSSYWLLFPPLLLLLFVLTRKTGNTFHGMVILVSILAIHTLAYPALVWFISKLFYYHTFSYRQTFQFGLPAYFIISVIIYSFSFLAFTAARHEPRKNALPPGPETGKQPVLSSLVVSESNNHKVVLPVTGIYYFSANPPYINIHHESKKYLYNDTLKSVETQLKNLPFARIHKSYIVNLHKVVSLRSRQNGDYDITLSDESVLRVSRMYAKKFKSMLEESHRVTIP